MQSHFWHGNSKALATLALPKFPGIMISDRYNHPCKCIHFFAMVVCCQILAYAPIYSYFCVVLRSPLTNVSPHTHLYPFLTYTITRTHLFLHRMHLEFWGKFPGHKAEKHVLCPNIYECLPCFSVRPHPCILSHPPAPIRTHLRIFTSAQTLNSAAYMYYLC